jgi:hypothetical protein
MKLQNLFYTLIFIFAFALAGCDEPVEKIEPSRYHDSPAGNFEAFWHGLSDNYVFWHMDSTDWDALYKQYRPRITDTMSKDDLYSIFENMSATLIDGHYSITYPESSGRPRFNPRDLVLELGQRYFNEFLPRLYLEDAQFASDSMFLYGFIEQSTDKKLLYIRLNGFEITPRRFQLESHSEPGDLEFLENLQQLLLNPPAEVAGYILDIRDNGGGNVNDLNFIASPFTAERKVFGYLQPKLPGGRNAVAPKSLAFFEPAIPGKSNKLPLMVLTNSASVSMAEITPMALSTLDNVTVIGVNTFGGTAMFSEGEGYSGGGFKIPDGTSFYVSNALLTDLNGNSYEGKGFPPDVLIPIDINRLVNEREDNQLEKAIELLTR